MYVRHLTSLQFLTYVSFLGVVLAMVMRYLPGKAPPVRTAPYVEEELGAHDGRLAKYFVAGGFFLVVGGLHMTVKNLPWPAEWLAGGGYPGHLVRDLSNTHVMIVGGGTLIATGLCWYALPRIVGRPLASNGLAQCAFWFTAAGLAVFYVALIGDGIAMARLVHHGWSYPGAKAHLGKWYKVPVGMGAGVMGLGYWCFATNVFLTIFQSRLVRVPKPSWHLWKFFAAGAGGLTVGTVQGVIQVQPAHADWLYRAGHAGEWIDPISHAHINLVTGLTMLVAGSLFAVAPRLGGQTPSRRLANTCFFSLLAGSLAFYSTCLYLGFHEGSLVVGRGLTPEQATEATPLHAPLILTSGIAMFAAFWLLLFTLVRTYRRAPMPLRAFVLAGCAALAVGTLQGPVQAVPAVDHLFEEGGQAGDVIVNLHAQLNMLGGLMMLLVGAAGALMAARAGREQPRVLRRTLVLVPLGMGVYYAAGIAFAAVEAHGVSGGQTFEAAVTALEPWEALVLVPAAAAVLLGFAAYARGALVLTRRERADARTALRSLPRSYGGEIPLRVRRRSPAALAAYELPMGMLGFPGIGWLFAGFPLTASVLLLAGPALAWAVLPIAFTPYGDGPLRAVGWKAELVYLPATALLSAALLYRAHRLRRLRLYPKPPRPRRGSDPRLRIKIAAGVIGLVLVSLPLVPAIAGIGVGSVRYSYLPRLTPEVTGQFLVTPKGTVKLFAWTDLQERFPSDALRIHASDLRGLVARAAAVDSPSAYRLFDIGRGGTVELAVRATGPRSLTLAPRGRLRPGRYVFSATHEGMFGGRDYAYLAVVPPGDAATAIRTSEARTPAVLDTLLPVASALVALLFAAQLIRSFLRRRAGQKALWAAGFLFFAAAATAEALAQRNGWTAGLFRAYYLCGGVLTVAFLGAGSAWLQLRPRARDVVAGALAVATVAAAIGVSLAPVDMHELARATSHPPANGALGGHVFLWAIALNTLGTIALLGGSLLSIARRQRVRANVWIASGAAVVALSTGLSRGGEYSLVYVGQLVGISLMFVGFSWSGRPAPRRERAPGGAAPARAR